MLSSLLTLSACSEVDPTRASCVAGLWQNDRKVFAAVNVREDNSVRLTLFDGRVWTLKPQEGRWVGGQGQVTATGDAMLDDRDCAAGNLVFRFRGSKMRWRRAGLKETPVRFRSGGVLLSGKLVVPTSAAVKSLVVLLHGSEQRSGVASNPLQYLLPSQGVAAFVFDKRGTGSSGGDYTQNFHILAGDAIAALGAARQAFRSPSVPVGLQGGSQGSWVAVLAASRAAAPLRPQFLISCYGLAQSPLEEDREEVFDDLRRHNVTDASVFVRAREITDATARIMQSDFKSGFERLDVLKEKYGSEPWYDFIEGDFSGDFLSMPSWLLSIVGPIIDDDTTWEFDPVLHIKRLAIPMLWILAGKDSEAPSGTTFQVLKELQREGLINIDVAMFPETEHGITTFTERGLERTLTGVAPEYFGLLAEWSTSRTIAPRAGVSIAAGRAAESAPPSAQD